MRSALLERSIRSLFFKWVKRGERPGNNFRRGQRALWRMSIWRCLDLTDMFTLFHLCELSMASIGFVVGVRVGFGWLGWIGAIAAGAIGFVAGFIVGRFPYVICHELIKRSLRRSDVATLRARLDREYYIAHLIIANLVTRGEPIESFQEYVAGLLRSDCADRRRFGARISQIWPQTIVKDPPR